MLARVRNRVYAVVLLFAIFITITGHSGTLPGKGSGPDAFIKVMAERVMTIVGDKEKGSDDKLGRLRALFVEGFDVPLIARFVLGRNWRRASKSEQGEYLDLFEDMMVHTYIRRFREYDDAKFAVDGVKKRSDRDFFVNSTVKRPGEPAFIVDWRVRIQNGSFKIVDVVTEGVSMSLSQRDDFSSVIQRNGGKVEGLLRELRDKFAEPETLEKP